MVRSGIHALSATTVDAYGVTVGPVALCFAAEGGAGYVLRFTGAARRVPRLFDQRTAAEVQTAPLAPGERCAPPRSPRPIVAERPEALPAAPAQAVDVAAAGEETQSIPNIGAPAEESALPPPPEAPARAAAAQDGGAPLEHPFLPPTYVSREEVPVQPRWVRHPGNGLMFDFGAFLGGTDLATAMFNDGSTSTLSAGSGILLSVGLMLTPLWVGDGAGFGVDAFAAVKYDSVGSSGDSVSLTRYPLGLGAHLLLHIDDRWWFILRGGIIKETGISLSADGYGDASLTGSLGGFGEGGIYYILHMGDDHVAFVWTFRYSASHDSADGASISANSGGVIWALHINL
jgi:hypothetical protein